MNTELIKQLKDAGFPNSEKWEIDEKLGFIIRINDTQVMTVPKLTDLLSALSSYPIMLLINMKDGCSAQIWNKGLDNMDWYPTPEEAIARLWLEIDGIKKWNKEQINKKSL